MSKGYMGQVTDRDIEMVNLLIDNPNLSLDEIGSKLGVTKQAVAERKSRLEKEGFTKNFYFWNITPRFECTKRVLIKFESGFDKINSILELLNQFSPLIVFFKDNLEDFFDGEASSLTETISQVEGILLFNDKKEETQLTSDLKNLGVTSVVIEPILFSRLLGEKCNVTVKSPRKIRSIAMDISKKLSSEASVQAILYGMPFYSGKDLSPVDQFDIIIIRDERFQPNTDSYERRVQQTLVDYHFTNIKWFMKRKSSWIKNMKLVYVKDETISRRIQRKLKSI